MLAFSFPPGSLRAQETGSKQKHPQIVLPKLLDELVLKKYILDSLDLDTILYYGIKQNRYNNYVFYFDLDTNGVVVPTDNDGLDKPIFNKINAFINTRFRQYRWRPGHLQGCATCRITVFLKFGIYFDILKNKTTVVIRMIPITGGGKSPYITKFDVN